MALLAAGEALPLPEGREPSYGQLEQLGPGALLFLAMHAADRGLSALELDLLGAAAEREEGLYRRRAAELLAARLDPEATPREALSFARSKAAELIDPRLRAELSARALLALGRHGAAAQALEGFREANPGQASDPELAGLAALAGLAGGDPRWLDEFRALFAAPGEATSYAMMARVLDAFLAAAGGEGQGATGGRMAGTPSADELELARARSLVGARDYGAAVLAFRRLRHLRAGGAGVPAELVPWLDAAGIAALAGGLSRAAYSDLGKALIYGSPDEGAAGMRALGDAASADAAHADPSPASRETAYIRLYWAGRFARAAGDWAAAEGYFRRASSLADSGADRDAAQWYAVEAAGRRSPADAARLLADALSLTADPGYYADLLEPMSRQALLDRDGLTLALLDAAAGARATPADAARISYLCARAARQGIVDKANLDAAFGEEARSDPAYRDPAAYAASRFRRAAAQTADPWYRLLALWRLDPASFAAAYAPAADVAAGAATGVDLDDGTYSVTDETAAYGLGLLRFGLVSRLQPELGASIDLIPPEAFRVAAERLHAAGNHPAAIRAMAPLMRRAGYLPSKRDRELFWPRPYAELFAEAAAATGLPEFLLYGLARSESLFQADAVSSAGAVGLAQLMPATAAETAARLKLEAYELTDAGDSLRLGSAYLKRLLDSLGGAVPAAVFSYNAGLSRYRGWQSAAGRLPPDLTLETLAYSETRQYGRNVLGAAAMYALLYGGADPGAFMPYLLGE